jgi:recombination protein RecT
MTGKPNEAAAAAIEQARANPVAMAKPADALAAMLDKWGHEIQAALPEGWDSVRFQRVLSTEVRRNPALLDANRVSLIAAMLLAAQLGLEPGPSQRVYFIPYGGEVQFQLGWRGMAELARRSGEVAKLTTAVVREGDVFSFALGFEPTIDHRPMLGGAEDRPVIAAYAAVIFTNGERDVEVMDASQLAKAKASALAKAKNKSNPELPWNKWESEQQRKTVLKRLAKRLPMSEHDHRAIESDETVRKSIEADMLAVPSTDEVPNDVMGETIEGEVVEETCQADPPTDCAGCSDAEACADPRREVSADA